MFVPGHAVGERKQSHYSLLCSLYHVGYKKDDLPLCLLTKNEISLISVGLWNLTTSEVTSCAQGQAALDLSPHWLQVPTCATRQQARAADSNT